MFLLGSGCTNSTDVLVACRDSVTELFEITRPGLVCKRFMGSVDAVGMNIGSRRLCPEVISAAERGAVDITPLDKGKGFPKTQVSKA